MESILTSVKKLLGIAKEYTHFDADLIMHINSVFLILNQLGVGTAEPFFIEDDSAYWEDFVEFGSIDLVKSYMGLKVKLLFDPPISSAAMDSANRMISEFEWRLTVAAESKEG
jgi:hypothetical protein